MDNLQFSFCLEPIKAKAAQDLPMLAVILGTLQGVLLSDNPEQLNHIGKFCASISNEIVIQYNKQL